MDRVILALGYSPTVTKHYQEDDTFARGVGGMADWQEKSERITQL